MSAVIVSSESRSEFTFRVDEAPTISVTGRGQLTALEAHTVKFETAVGSALIRDASATGWNIRKDGSRGAQERRVWFTGWYLSVPPPPFVREIARMHGLIWPEDVTS